MSLSNAYDTFKKKKRSSANSHMTSISVSIKTCPCRRRTLTVTAWKFNVLSYRQFSGLQSTTANLLFIVGKNLTFGVSVSFYSSITHSIQTVSCRAFVQLLVTLVARYRQRHIINRVQKLRYSRAPRSVRMRFD